MNDIENKIINEYQSLYDSLNKWGGMVDKYIMEILNAKAEIKDHIKIPPKYRLKDEKSYLGKAIYRNKGYKNHLLEIEDKIGTRIILLKSDEVIQVSEILMQQQLWQAKQTKGIFDFIPENANNFDYQSIHLVCIPPADSADFPKDQIPQLTCEIQIRTLLQHAFAEISHDSTYKGVYKNDTDIIRKLAKSMALMEATDDYFLEVFEMMTDEKRYYNNYLKELIKLSQKFVPSFTLNELDKKLTETIFELLPAIKVEIEALTKFTQTNENDIKILLANSKSLITQQPVIILIAYYIVNAPNSLKTNWKLSDDILRNLFTSIGHSFDSY